jgi:hypothetical protein
MYIYVLHVVYCGTEHCNWYKQWEVCLRHLTSTVYPITSQTVDY